MSARRLMVALVVLATAVGITASSVLAGQNRAQATTIRVTAKDFKFILSARAAKAGVVKFIVTNKGAAKHDFKIGTKKTPLLAHNKSATLTVTLRKGTVKYICTVPGHASLGMKGTFTLR